MKKPIIVYLVDNEIKNAERYKRVLEATKEFTVRIINTFKAWEKILKNGIEPDAILCIDESLNNWAIPNGIALGRLFKKNWKHTPLIIYSSYSNNFEEAYKAGTQYYISSEMMSDSDLFSQILTNCVTQAAESLRLDTLRNLIEKMPLEIMLVDNNYKVILANRTKRELYGNIIGKICYKAFHNKQKPCNVCVVKQIMKGESFAQWQGWFNIPTWNEKAKRMINERYLDISAYPIETPQGNLIAEIINNRTEEQVVFELTRKLRDIADYEKLAHLTIDSIKKLGYIRSQFYILTEDENDIEYTGASKTQKGLDIFKLKKMGQIILNSWKKQPERTQVKIWPFDQLEKISEFDELRLQNGTPVVYSLVAHNFDKPDKKILGVIVTDREGDKRGIQRQDIKIIETIGLLLANAIKNIRSAKAKEIEFGRIEQYSKVIRDLLKILPDVIAPENISQTMINHARQILKNSNIYFYQFSQRYSIFNIGYKYETDRGNIIGMDINIILQDKLGNIYNEQKIAMDQKTYSKLHPVLKGKEKSQYIVIETLAQYDIVFLACPITFKNEKYGVLVANRHDDEAFDELEIEMFSTIANTCAMDLFNASISLTLEEALIQWESLGILHRYVGESTSHIDLINRCLTFVTARQGLRINRALFFEYNKKKDNFIFNRAIGSIKKEDFIKKRDNIYEQELSFEDLMINAPNITDREINEKLKGIIIEKSNFSLWHSLHSNDQVIIDLYKQPQLAEFGVFKELVAKIHMVYYIITIIPGKNEPLGCLIVDRRFDQHVFNEKDKQFLKTFASEMRRIIEVLQYRDKMIQNQYSSTLGWMASAVGHELYQPALAIHSALDKLKKNIDNKAFDMAIKKIKDIIQYKEHMFTIIEAIKGFSDIDKKEIITPAEIINQSKVLFEEKLKNHGIECEIDIEDNLPEIEFHSTSLKFAIANLVHNSYDAILNAERTIENKYNIKVMCCLKGKNIIFNVEDNAGGINEDILIKINKPGSTFSTKPDKGWGFGLNVVKQAAKLHDGSFFIKNTDKRKGAIASISIPIKSNVK